MPHLHPAALNLFFLWLGFLGEWKRVPDREGWEMCDCSYGFMLNRRVLFAPKGLVYIYYKAASSQKFSTCWGSGLHLHSTSIHNISVKSYTAIFCFTWPNTLGEYFTFQKIQIHLVDVGILSGCLFYLGWKLKSYCLF